MAIAMRWRSVAAWARWPRPRATTPFTFLLLILLLGGSHGQATKLRHSRYLEPKAPLRVDDEFLRENHNHKPVFSNCSNYAPEVYEGEYPGTLVLQVHAEDPDPLDEGGRISYSFVAADGEKLKFMINHRTGLIRTTDMLDRDEPKREKEVYLTVLATDNGSPQLYDFCTFKVTVKDDNDNAPVFDKVAYTEKVPQDLPIGREVMRVSATDIDHDNNSIVRYSLFSEGDGIYFRIDRNTGVIFLNQTIDKTPGYLFNITVLAKDLGNAPRFKVINLYIRVIESHKKAPTFSYRPQEPIKLRENFSDYEASIARLEAVSNVDESPDFFHFELITGRTEQTNKDNTFRLESNKNVAYIKLSKALDYESNIKYSLIVRVENKYQLAAETKVYIEVTDVNDNIPVFRSMKKGTVLENEEPGAPVVQVRAIDYDGTSANNQVTYALGNYEDLFTIDRYTGSITTLKTFDRETHSNYTVKVIATDNSPSALFKTGEHNKGEQSIRIEIADENDNAPHFTQQEYLANAIPEDANENFLVTEVKALDADTASPVTYSIRYGNIDDAFKIENTTGKIRVNKGLDYEKITQYNLTVRAFDGISEDRAIVLIFIENVNDIPPVFEDFGRDLTIQEERLYRGCITTVVAYDPDIKNRSADQHIVYSILKAEYQSLFAIHKDGCMVLKKPLDRDPPSNSDGLNLWKISIIAQDEDASQNSLRSVKSVYIYVTDINDNAPFLNMSSPIIWAENQEPSNITELKAYDYDSDRNGPPFTYRIDTSADSTILTNFEIRGNDLFAKVRFYREEKKSYDIPIAITDHGKPPLTGISKLTVIIGDKNDNSMKDSSSSSIFVYNYNSKSTDVDIGRVFVDDADDWDLNDKTFSWYQGMPAEGFSLDQNTGMIKLLSGTRNGTFLLKFTVTEKGEFIPRHEVHATVNVTVKEIPKEALVKSGPIRCIGISAEEFVAPGGVGISEKNTLQENLSSMLNVSVENVDAFTVLHSLHNNQSFLDVRFSAHKSFNSAGGNILDLN